MFDEREREQDLRHRLEELRRSDDLGAPTFRSVRDRADAARAGSRPVRASRAWILFAGVTAAAVLTLLFLRPGIRRPPARGEVAVAVADWKSPTDFLLETPGSELLERLPDSPPPVPDWALEVARPLRPAPQGTVNPSLSLPLKKGAAS